MSNIKKSIKEKNSSLNHTYENADNSQNDHNTHSYNNEKNSKTTNEKIINNKNESNKSGKLLKKQCTRDEFIEIAQNFLKEFLHDISSSFLNIYFGYETLFLDNFEESKKIVKDSLQLMRVQTELYKSLCSRNYSETLQYITYYFMHDSVIIDWMNANFPDKNHTSELEELWFPIFLLFLKKRFIKNAKISISKFRSKTRIVIKIHISKMVNFKEKDMKFLSGLSNECDSSFLDIFVKMTSDKDMRMKIDTYPNNTTSIEISVLQNL